MAGEWIKFRAALPNDPRVVKMAEFLRQQGSHTDDVNGNTPMRVTVRVTVVGLLQVWCMADEVGNVDGNDIVIPHTNAAQVTHFVDLYKFDDAMKLVDWIRDESGGVRFPNLLKYNTIRSSSATSGADRQRRYRERKAEKESSGGVLQTVTSPVTLRSNVTPLLSSPLLSESSEGMQGEGSPFDRFWAAYPRKVGKHKAREAWQKHKADGAIDDVLRMIRLLRDSPDWFQKEIKFIPHPATWINGRRWEDDDPERAEILGPRKTPEEIEAVLDVIRGIGGQSGGTPNGHK